MLLSPICKIRIITVLSNRILSMYVRCLAHRDYSTHVSCYFFPGNIANRLAFLKERPEKKQHTSVILNTVDAEVIGAYIFGFCR